MSRNFRSCLRGFSQAAQRPFYLSTHSYAFFNQYQIVQSYIRVDVDAALIFGKSCKIQLHENHSFRELRIKGDVSRIDFRELYGSLNFKATAIVGQTLTTCRKLHLSGEWISLFLFFDTRHPRVLPPCSFLARGTAGFTAIYRDIEFFLVSKCIETRGGSKCWCVTFDHVISPFYEVYASSNISTRLREFRDEKFSRCRVEE